MSEGITFQIYSTNIRIDMQKPTTELTLRNEVHSILFLCVFCFAQF